MESRRRVAEFCGGVFRTWVCLGFSSSSEPDEIEEALKKVSPEGCFVVGRSDDRRKEEDGFYDYRMVMLTRTHGILQSEGLKEFREKYVLGKRMGYEEDSAKVRKDGRDAVRWMRGAPRYSVFGKPFGDTWLELSELGGDAIMALAWRRGRPLTSEEEWGDLFEAFEESRIVRKGKGKEEDEDEDED